jgi:tRNA acetyltransferase TAN1
MGSPSIPEMIRDFNLLATTEIYNTSEGCSELWMLLRAVGDEDPAVDRSCVRGLIAARTRLDPLEAISKLREELRERPFHFKVLLRVIPAQKVVGTDLEEIVQTANVMATVMGEDESFRITVEKRRTGLGSREVIEAVAEGIDRHVDLEDPDWVVLIEIMGRVTGVSVVRPEDVLNVQKERPPLPSEGEEGPPLDEEHG